MYEYMEERNYGSKQKEQLKMFLNFLVARSKGLVPTGAKYIRDFVTSHPDYKQDSIVSKKINYDLLLNLM
jgi:glutamate--cysteine ligase catalytic subunit